MARIDRFSLIVVLAIPASLLGPEQLKGQVVIRESVAISPSSGFSKVVATNDTLTVQSDGLLKIEYTLADMIFSDFQSDATLHVTLNGLPFVDDTVAHHVGTADTTTYFCSSLPAAVRFGNRFTYNPPPDSAFVVGTVEEGDKIVFDYDGNKNASYYTEHTGGSGWLGSQIPQGCQEGSTFYPYEMITFDAILIPDTLNLKFNPPADSDSYPEPGLEVEITAIVTDAEDNGHVLFEIENFDYPDTEFPDTLIYFLEGTDTTLTLDPVSVIDDTARATLVTKETWGKVTLTATYTPEVVSKTQDGPTNPQVKIKDWPDDTDFDGIPDRWEMEHGGSLELEDHREALEGCSGPSDTCWDSDGYNISLLGMGQVGDGISKLSEYQGVYIQGMLQRLEPDSMEIFVDVDLSGYFGEAGWAFGELKNQLGIAVRYVDGLDQVLAGTTKFSWSGPEEYAVLILFNDSTMSSRYKPSSTLYARDNGIFVEEGVFSADPPIPWDKASCVNDRFGCQPDFLIGGGPLLGWMNDKPGWFTSVFVSSVYPNGHNALFDDEVNSIPESALTWFRFPAQVISTTPSGSGKSEFRAGYLNFSHNDDGDTDDLINPFNLVAQPVRSLDGSPVLRNDDYDDNVLGATFSQMLRRTMEILSKVVDRV